MAFYDSINDASNFLLGLRNDSGVNYGIYFEGYKSSADQMTKYLLQKPFFAEKEALPVAYLYRHALELSLKHILDRCALLAAFRFRPDIELAIKHNHDLLMLGDLVKMVLDKLLPNDEELSKFLKLVLETCYDLAEIDKNSNLFRYPIGYHSDKPAQKWLRINLRAYAERMSMILDGLGTVHFGLNLEMELAQEFFEQVQELIEKDISSLRES